MKYLFDIVKSLCDGIYAIYEYTLEKYDIDDDYRIYRSQWDRSENKT